MIRTSVILGFLAAMLWALLAATAAEAHKAPSGWSYPAACCSNVDCREVPDDWVKEKPDGYQVVITGEMLFTRDKRIKDSPDGHTHWCSVAGALDSRTICLFVPPKGM